MSPGEVYKCGPGPAKISDVEPYPPRKAKQGLQLELLTWETVAPDVRRIMGLTPPYPGGGPRPPKLNLKKPNCR